MRVADALLLPEGTAVMRDAGALQLPMLQHRQLHRLFTSILCTAILPILHYACPTLLYVLPDCSADGVSPPSGAIRNLRPIL